MVTSGRLSISIIGFAITACGQTGTESDTESSRNGIPVVHIEGSEAFDVISSLAGIHFDEPEAEFGHSTIPEWETKFEKKSDYELFDEYVARFKSRVANLSKDKATIWATYLSLGPIEVGKKWDAKGAVSLDYSMSDEMISFTYNPAYLNQYLRWGPLHSDVEGWRAMTSYAVVDIDCFSNGFHGAVWENRNKFERTVSFDMKRDTAEAMSVLTSPTMFAVARLEYDLSDERYSSEDAISFLLREPYKTQRLLVEDAFEKGHDLNIVISDVYGPTSALLMYDEFSEDGNYTIVRRRQVANITDVIIADSDTSEVLYRLTGCGE